MFDLVRVSERYGCKYVNENVLFLQCIYIYNIEYKCKSAHMRAHAHSSANAMSMRTSGHVRNVEL